MFRGEFAIGHRVSKSNYNCKCEKCIDADDREKISKGESIKKSRWTLLYHWLWRKWYGFI